MKERILDLGSPEIERLNALPAMSVEVLWLSKSIAFSFIFTLPVVG